MSNSSYDNSQFDIERATGGLVLSLYIGAAIFLVVIVWMVLQNMEDPDDAANTDGQSGMLHIENPPELIADKQAQSLSSIPSLYS